jgi:hypothetical protein
MSNKVHNNMTALLGCPMACPNVKGKKKRFLKILNGRRKGYLQFDGSIKGRMWPPRPYPNKGHDIPPEW